jgi:hypothetical protein
MKVILWLGLSILSGCLYRLGGAKKQGDWLDFARNSKTRDVGCSLLFLGLFWAIQDFKMASWKQYAIAFGLSWGFLSTYWDWLFGYDNFWFHGLICGLSALPLYWCGVHWWMILIRAIICAVVMGLAHKWINKDIYEEPARGIVYIATIPILLI